MAIYIVNSFYYLPQKILSNKDLSVEFSDWDSTKIHNKTGIDERRIANIDETALDLSVKATIPLLNYCNNHNVKIDYLIYISQTHDYLFPGNSTLLLKKIGLNGIPSIDVNLACSGYVYGLNLAYSLISANQAKNVLLVTSDTYSKIIHKYDKSVRTLFGDGSSATLISNLPITKGMNLELIDFSLGSNGDKFDSLYVKDGGFRNPIKQSSYIEKIDDKGYTRRDVDLFMNGEEILNFTMDVVPKNILSLLEKNKLTINNIKYFLFHQANKFILDFLGRSLKITSKLVIDLLHNGNTTSSSIPILLSKNFSSLNICDGEYLLFSGFGVGLSWGSVLVKKH
jgi:3-oxoacyl-[acyl-carrier-protein] synthase-3